MRSTTEQAAGAPVVVLAPSGELDVAAGAALRAALLDACSVRLPVVVDLSEVTFVDSAALGVLVGAARRLQSYGCRLTVRRPTSRVLAVLVMTGLDRLLDVEQDGPSTTHG